MEEDILSYIISAVEKAVGKYKINVNKVGKV